MHPPVGRPASCAASGAARSTPVWPPLRTTNAAATSALAASGSVVGRDDLGGLAVGVEQGQPAALARLRRQRHLGPLPLHDTQAGLPVPVPGDLQARTPLRKATTSPAA